MRELPAWSAHREHDDAPAVVLGDVAGVELRAVGDADQVGAELARLVLDLVGGQRPLEDVHALPCSFCVS